MMINTALCAYLKPRNIFESATKRHFQKYFCLTQNLNRLYLTLIMSTPEKLKERFAAITIKRELLVQLSLKDNLGTLSIDVIQALEELDDLLIEIRKVFPDWQD